MTNSNLVPAQFYFDEEETNILLKGLHNPDSNWNGFAQPYISEKSILDFVKVMKDGDGLEFHLTKKNELVVIDRYEGKDGKDSSDVAIIETISVDGEKYFNLGWFGFTFQVKEETLVLNRRRFLTWYFIEANFNANVFDGLLSDGKYCLDMVELLDSVGTFPAYILEDGQVYLPNADGKIDSSNYKLEIN